MQATLVTAIGEINMIHQRDSLLASPFPNLVQTPMAAPN
jgi:hypothetical protein